MIRGSIKAWEIIHRWTSLVCTLFLLMLCITGLPLIFHDEIDALTAKPDALAALPAGQPSLSLDRLLDVALAQSPGDAPLYMSFDTDRPVVNVTTGPTPDAPETEMRFISLDRRTGTILPPAPPGGVMDILLRLHTDMFAGLPGMLFLGAMGLLFFVAIISGVVLYAPFMSRLRFGTIRAERSARVRWTDHHNLLGIITLLWASVVALTGTINTLATPLTDYWKVDQLAALAQSGPQTGMDRPFTSIQQAHDRALAAAPGMRVQFIAFPGVTFSSDRHYAVFLHGDTALTQKILLPAMIDAQDGRLTSLQPMPWYMKALLLSQPLHFGDYAGLPMKLLWAALDLVTIVVLGSGLYLWGARTGIWRRRNRPADQ